MKAVVIKNRQFGPYAHLHLSAPAISRKAKPGQFIEVLIQGAGAPFWRRPFSICRAEGGQIELLVKSVGRGSSLLAQSRVGQELDCIGPLGQGFKLTGRAPVLLVAGGFGIAPLYFLAERLKRQGRQVEFYAGGRCQEDLLLMRELRLLGVHPACTTEDGSFGERGRVTALLQARLERDKKKCLIAAAGPYPMLRAVAQLADRFGIQTEVSLEEIMACGLGVCNGCVITVDGKYQRVCKDGPVFSAGQVEWEARP